MAQSVPQTLDELRALPPTMDPAERQRRKQWQKDIEKRMNEDKHRHQQVNDKGKGKTGKDGKKNEGKVSNDNENISENINEDINEEKEDDINHIHVDSGSKKSKAKHSGIKRSRRLFDEEELDDINVNSDGAFAHSSGGAARRGFDGRVEGPNLAINAVTQKWMNGEIDDEKYGELLGKLKDVQAAANVGLQPMQAAVPKKKRRKIGGNGGSSSIVCYPIFIFLFPFLFVFLFVFLFFSFNFFFFFYA